MRRPGKSYKDCQFCGMPIRRDEKGGGTNADGSKSGMYCSHCYEAGAFTLPNLSAAAMSATEGPYCAPHRRIKWLGMSQNSHDPSQRTRVPHVVLPLLLSARYFIVIIFAPPPLRLLPRRGQI